MTGRLSFPAEWKAVPGDPGELEGYASVFGNVDQGGDVVLPGAFRKTLADWSRSRQPMPLIADHDLSSEGVIGSVSKAAEDATGLRITARFSSVPKAQDIRTKMIEGHLKGMSFTYETVRSYVGTAAGKSVRYLQELKIFEATVTPFPMNTLALASAKAPDQGNISTPDAGDLNAAARRYCTDQGWAMADGSYPIRPANLHGASDLAKAIRAVGRGSGSHDAIRRHIAGRAKAIGMSDQIPDGWTSTGSASLDLLAELMSDPDAMIGVGTLLAERKARTDLAALEAWAALQPRVRTDPTEAPPLSKAELTNREAIGRARFSPPTRCGVCWRCQLGGPCDVYR
jgi:HK97 family phage prohead protease